MLSAVRFRHRMPSCDHQRSRCRPLSTDNEDDYDYTMGDLSSLAASFGDGVGAEAQYPPAYHGDFERNVFDQVCSFGLEVSDFFIAICMQYAYCDAI